MNELTSKLITNKLIKVMAISSAMSVVLLFFRIEWSGNLSYIFLSWNLFLAWIPFLFSLILTECNKQPVSRIKLFALFCGWLVFFPNAPYILTDMFHLHIRKEIPLWFDLVLIVSFAWNGLLLGYASLFEIQHFLIARFSQNAVSFFIGISMILSGFGIYLGRYPRYNSWEIITNPIDLFSNIFNMLIHPMQNTRMVGVTFFFSVFLMVSYWTLSTLIKENKK
ncbi:MAG: DUF1361 domain-containing protein [Bacteroidia bacterium]